MTNEKNINRAELKFEQMNEIAGGRNIIIIQRRRKRRRRKIIRVLG